MDTPEIVNVIADNVAKSLSESGREYHDLLSHLKSVGVDNPVGVAGYLMGHRDESAYGYEVGTHETIWCHDHEITWTGSMWKFEHLYSARVQQYYDILDGLKTTKRLIDQGVIS